ncbi:MAG: hypothetical protein FWE22_06350 [Firmicutes bacterium]|nr:hypothetical protein [Bacillota bacterium]
MNTTKSKRKNTLSIFITILSVISTIALLITFNSTSAENSVGEEYDAPLLPFIHTASINEWVRDDRVEIILRHRYSQITEIDLDVFNQATNERFESITDLRNVRKISNGVLTLRPTFNEEK